MGPPSEAEKKISPSVCNLSGKVARHSRLLKLWTRRRASPTLCLSRRSLRQIADSRFESEGEVSQGAFRSADSSCFAPFYFGSRELHRRDAFHPGSLRCRFSGGRKGGKEEAFQREREVCLGNHRRFVEWLKAPFVRKKPTSNWAFSDRREKETHPPELHFC